MFKYFSSLKNNKKLSGYFRRVWIVFPRGTRSGKNN